MDFSYKLLPNVLPFQLKKIMLTPRSIEFSGNFKLPYYRILSTREAMCIFT